VDNVYTGIKSPTKGINSIVFMAEDILLLVIKNNMLVTITSNMSPIIGVLKIGAAMKSTASAIKDIPSAEIDLQLKDAAFNICMIYMYTIYNIYLSLVIFL
jgi:hypothetical protein